MLAIAVVLGLAFAVRVFRLDHQSLWGDEIASVFMAGRPLEAVAQGATIDIHPPLYYYLLHFWMRVAGNSEFSVRFLSLVLGVLTVAVTFALGRRILGGKVGLLASLFLAMAPLQVYYSQETRMYTLAALLAVSSCYLFLRVLPHAHAERGAGLWQRSGACWATYVAASTALLYAHYAGAAVLVAQSLTVFVLQRRRARYLLQWVAAHMVILLLFLPWLMIALGQLRSHPGYDPLPLTGYIARTAAGFTLGLAAAPEPWWAAVGLVWLLVAIGAVACGRQTRDAPSRLLAPWLVVPLASVLLISLLVKPFFEPRFLMPATPAFALLLAAGIMASWRAASSARRGRMMLRIAPLAAALTAVLLAGQGLMGYYYDNRYARDDWRGLARQIQMVAQPTDAIVLDDPGLTETFSYYYRGKHPYYGLPRPAASAEETESALQDLMARHDRVWLILWGEGRLDPTHAVETWLDQNSHRVQEKWVGNLRVAVYARPLPTQEKPSGASFDADLQLVSYALGPDELPADGALRVTLRWRALKALDEGYVISLKLVGQDGHTWATADSEPAADSEPTVGWPAGREVLDRRGLLPFPGTPPGEYKVLATVYSRLGHVFQPEGPLTDGKSVPLGTVRLTAPSREAPVEALPIEHRLDLSIGPAKLLGYNLEPGKGPLMPGQRLTITLFWQASERPGFDAKVMLELAGKDGGTIARRQSQPIVPMPLWRAKQALRDPHDLTIDPRAMSGDYRLELSFIDGPKGTGLGMASTLGAYGVYAPRLFDAPKMERTLSANFGDRIELLGYDLSAYRGEQAIAHKPLVPGDEVRLTLYWRARKSMDENYTVFSHALADGRIIGQSDGWPGGPERPTSSWVRGEIVTDKRVFHIGANASSGEVQIQVGLYLQPLGERLPLLDKTGQPLDTRIILDRFPMR
ncbi:MAG: glycosyltransferase family 39 protein [Chloroflexi bacterium]|nr:glycosyltransferase family 39 protein [Chloroflexota bacterium]